MNFFVFTFLFDSEFNAVKIHLKAMFGDNVIFKLKETAPSRLTNLLYNGREFFLIKSVIISVLMSQIGLKKIARH